MEKFVAEFTPLAEIGSGRAEITDNSVLIEVTGINGSLKAWLTGGEAIPIGNLVGGRLRREIDTTGHNGILITQSGRQMLYSRFRPEEKRDEREETTPSLPEKGEIPFTYGNFKWRKITEKLFASQNNGVKCILSNKKVYENFKRHGCYWFGENGTDYAIALKCETPDSNPLDFLSHEAAIREGFRIICIDTEKNRLYTL